MNILYMAISKDGFIAGPADETPWGDESWQAFQEFVSSCDAVLLGRRTFEIMQRQDEFIHGPRYIVATHDSDFDTGSYEKLAINSRRDLPEVARLGIIGGGDLNGQLAGLGAIDEIILDTEESVELHDGVRLFGHHKLAPSLQLLDSRRLGPAVVQRHYRVTGWQAEAA